MLARRSAGRTAVAGACTLALLLTPSPALASAAIPIDHGAAQAVTGTAVYTYETDYIYWSVTALRSEGGKPDLTLTADEAGEVVLASSRQKARTSEFVAVDSNHADVPATYFLTATSKGGGSTIELDSNAEILFDETPVTLTMLTDDVVLAYDVYLEDGVDYVLSVTGSGDAGLHLLRSDPGLEGSWYRSRADAAASADKKPAGKPEKIKITGTDDWYALVVLNNRGSGTYELLKTLA